ncbi:MAG TPA: tRNA pseudouridine(55) synthase TruB [Aggregatilineales bacterium]|nr:tRNA pseudouridine(55) synthase TruB [Aggregatilineales bacterium]
MTAFGFLPIDKPKGLTSHDVVARIRRGTGIKRIGHAGTLDPMATGALIVCVGAATRLSDYVMHGEKVYRAVLRLGVETDTYDAEGSIVATADASWITPEAIEAEVSHFQGEIEQIPPMYSAIKRSGKKLYELARDGVEIDRAPRRVWLRTNLLAFNPPDAELEITCSAGTYIRSVAHDLGAVLGVGAHLTALRRLRSGDLRDLVAWEDLNRALADGSWTRYLLTERDLLAHIPAVHLDRPTADDVLHGRFVRLEPDFQARSPDSEAILYRAYDPDDRFIALLERHESTLEPTKVFG